MTIGMAVGINMEPNGHNTGLFFVKNQVGIPLANIK